MSERWEAPRWPGSSVMAGTGSSSVRFVTDKAFHEVLGGVDNRTTLLLGHTRWRTRGDEQVNENNHPIRAGNILGIHNGTTYNANYLFRRFKLRRFAEVDSELLCRLAGRAARHRVLQGSSQALPRADGGAPGVAARSGDHPRAQGE